ncbi:MAG: class I SAM-dependent methyltransferase [Bacilli bacterium]
MTMTEQVEAYFSHVNDAIIVLHKDLGCSYVEGVASILQTLLEGNVHEDASEETAKRVRTALENVDMDKLTVIERRHLLQIILLKGMRQGVQSNHQMTPDSIGLLVRYCIEKYFVNKKDCTLFDPVVGTGNLVNTLLEKQDSPFTNVFATEYDETLMQIAYYSAELLEMTMNLYRGDVLKNDAIPQVDCVVADVPVGYYPNNDIAQHYNLCRGTENMSYSHELIMEHSIAHTKEGGYLFFIVPQQVFLGDDYSKLRSYLYEQCVVEGFIGLPTSMFSNAQHAKGILILRKKGDGVVPPKEPMLVDFPSFQKMKAVENVMQQMNEWFARRLR